MLEPKGRGLLDARLRGHDGGVWERMCVRILATLCVRVLRHFHPRREGAGKAGRRLHPWVPCNKKHGGRTTGSTGITPAFPARRLYGLLRTLPGDRAFLPPSPAAALAARALSASVGAPGPHDFAVRSHAIRLRFSRLTQPRPSHPASNVRDDRDTPLQVEAGRRVSKVICGENEAECFSRADWMGQITLILQGNFRSSDMRDHVLSPHPEEPRLARRLKGWPRARSGPHGSRRATRSSP